MKEGDEGRQNGQNLQQSTASKGEGRILLDFRQGMGPQNRLQGVCASQKSTVGEDRPIEESVLLSQNLKRSVQNPRLLLAQNRVQI